MKWLSIYIALPLIVGASQPYLRPILRRRFTARLRQLQKRVREGHCSSRSVALRRQRGDEARLLA
jgi:hypothetical protein